MSVLDQLKPHMCSEAAEKYPYLLKYVPDHLKTPEMCSSVVNAKADVLQYVPEYLKTKDKAVKIWVLFTLTYPG